MKYWIVSGFRTSDILIRCQHPADAECRSLSEMQAIHLRAEPSDAAQRCSPAMQPSNILERCNQTMHCRQAMPLRDHTTGNVVATAITAQSPSSRSSFSITSEAAQRSSSIAGPLPATGHVSMVPEGSTEGAMGRVWGGEMIQRSQSGERRPKRGGREREREREKEEKKVQT
ncbi:hypothetical protein ANO11243_067610 [Dothideomycetidae sp. 11243]|nr:hypothetical protein ANO11243_067610 [fungal sp. No.11243]